MIVRRLATAVPRATLDRGRPPTRGAMLDDTENPKPAPEETLLERLGNQRAYDIRRGVKSDMKAARRSAKQAVARNAKIKEHRDKFTAEGRARILCEKCETEIYQLVDVTMRCPLGWQSLTKDSIRDDHVSVMGVKWNDTQWFCQCPPTEQPGNKDRRRGAAGKRWNKGGKPTPHQRALNLCPATTSASAVSPEELAAIEEETALLMARLDVSFQGLVNPRTRKARITKKEVPDDSCE